MKNKLTLKLLVLIVLITPITLFKPHLALSQITVCISGGIGAEEAQRPRTWRNAIQNQVTPNSIYISAMTGLNGMNVSCVNKIWYHFPGAGNSWIDHPGNAVTAGPIQLAYLYNQYSMYYIDFKYRRTRFNPLLPLFPGWNVYDYARLVIHSPKNIITNYPSSFCHKDNEINLFSYVKFHFPEDGFINSAYGQIPPSNIVDSLILIDSYGNSIPYTINPIDYPEGINNFKWIFRSKKITSGNNLIEKPFQLNFIGMPAISIGNIPDTIYNTDPIFTIPLNSNQYTTQIYPVTPGIINNAGSFQFNPATVMNGLIYICFKAQNSVGCEIQECKPIFVKYNPGVPPTPSFDAYNSTLNFYSHNRFIQQIALQKAYSQCGNNIGCSFDYPSIVSSISTIDENHPKYYKIQTLRNNNETYACAGTNHYLQVENPNIYNSNPIQNYTYKWYQSPDLLTPPTLIGTGTNINFSIPNNDTVFYIFLSAVNYLGVEGGKNSLKIISKANFKYEIADSLSCIPNNNNYSYNYPIWSEYLNYSSGVSGAQFNIIDSLSRIINWYLSGNIISTGKNINISLPNNDSTIIKAEYISKYPYYTLPPDPLLDSAYRHPNLLFSNFPSNWKPMGFNEYQYSGCECISTDSIVLYQSPKINFTIPAIDTLLPGTLLNIQNNTSFADSHLWNFLDGNYSINKDPFYYLYDSGCQDLYYAAYNNKGCKSDTSLYCYTYVVDEYMNENNFIINDDNISVYPNPFTDQLNINVSTPGEYTITIYSTVGSIVYQTKQSISESFILNQINMASGVYLLKIANVNSTKEFKIIKK